MTRKTFIKQYTDFIKKAMFLAEKAKDKGIGSLEDYTEDLDSAYFRDGLRMVIDEVETPLIDEIMSNRIAFEKDKHKRLLMSLQKRFVLAIRAKTLPRYVCYLLLSGAGLSAKEEKAIEKLSLLRD